MSTDTTPARKARSKGRQILDILEGMTDRQLQEAASEVSMSRSWSVRAFLAYTQETKPQARNVAGRPVEIEA